MSEPKVPTRWPRPRAAWLLLAAACAGTIAIRWRLRGMPLERDEGEYAYFGQLLLRGLPPFRGAYSLKLPGTQTAYAAAMAVFGQTAAGIRLGLLAVNAGTTALLFLVGRRLLGTLGGLAAAAAFAWLSASTSLLALFGHATHFVLLPALAGLLLLLRAADSGRLPAFLGSGLLLGVAVVMKQPGAVFVAFAAGWLAWSRLSRPGESRRRLLAELGALLGGAAAPLALVVVWVSIGGTFETFWFWVVRYAREYATSLPLSDGAGYLARNAAPALGQAWILWALAGCGLALTAWPRWPVNRAFLLGLLAFSFLGASAGLYYRPHYLILVLPAASLLVGAALRFAEHRGGSAGLGVPVAALALAAAGCVQAAWAQRDPFFRLSPDQVSRATYGANPFPESPVVARYLAERTRPDDRIAVLGSEPQILFYSRRTSATGHVYVYGLMEPQPLARAMQEEMASEVAAARPAYLVWVLVPTSWLMQAASDRWILEWARRYVEAQYDLVGQVLILGPDRTEYYWEAEVDRAPGGRVNRLLVFRRRDFAPRAG